jgi:hypothetical protein
MNSPEPIQKAEALSTSDQAELLPDPENDVATPGPSLTLERCLIKRYLKRRPPRPTPKPEHPEVRARNEQAQVSAGPSPEQANPSSTSELLPPPVGQVDAARGSRDVSYYVNRGIVSVSRRLGNRLNLSQVDRERPERTDPGSPLVESKVPSVFLTD